MKIIKIGTFNKQGVPINWHLDEIGMVDKSKQDHYSLGIIKEKVYVNGIEIVQWTDARNKAMGLERKTNENSTNTTI